MANAMPQALGDLLTAAAYNLRVRLIVFNYGRLGVVKREQEQGGLPELDAILHNPDLAQVARGCGLHGIRVDEPQDLDAAVQEALHHNGPVLLEVVNNPRRLAFNPRVPNQDAPWPTGCGGSSVGE